jgi:hypothetical protein
MRAKLVTLFVICSIVVDVSAVGTAIYIFAKGREWHGGLVHFMWRCWENFLSLESASGHGLISGLLVALLEMFAIFSILSLLGGATGVKKRIEAGAISVAVLVILVALVYGVQFAWEAANTTYESHRSLRQANISLRSKNQALTIANAQLVTFSVSPIETVSIPLRPMTSGSNPAEDRVMLANGNQGYVYEVIGITRNRIVPLDATLSCDHDMFVMRGAVCIGGVPVTGRQQPFMPTDPNVTAGSYYRNGRIRADQPAWTVTHPLSLEIFSTSPTLNCRIQESEN